VFFKPFFFLFEFPVFPGFNELGPGERVEDVDPDEELGSITS